MQREKAAHLAKKQDAQVPAQEVEAAHRGFADIPLESDQEQANDEDLAQQ